MRYHQQFFVFLFLLLAAVPGVASAEVVAWFAPSATKVLQDARPEASVTRAELCAARGEVEACQLVLRSDEAVAGVRVRCSDFGMAGGPDALPVKLLRVAYVPNIVEKTPYPDPLPPLGGVLRLEAGKAQPVWISVRVPRGGRPGDYAATVTVEAGGQRIERRVQLHVWNFAIPETPSSATAFGLTKEDIARQHGVKVESPESRRLYGAYYEMLLDHGISAYEIPADVMSDEGAKYLDDPRMTSYQIPYPGSDDALKAMVRRLKERGWYAKGFFYPVDEPVTKEAYEQLKRVGERLERLAPGYRWVAPFFRGPDWDSKLTVFDLMAGRLNIWCPNSQYLDTEARARPSLAARQKQGEHVWWYVCCGPGAPYCNFFVDMSAMAHRVLFWQQKRENVEGLLYWDTTWWNPASTKDPWSDMATVKDINTKIRGDGSLLYPGKQVGVDGPVSSLRLEMIRDGLEDYDYLALSDAWLGKEATQGVVAKIVRSLKEYEQDPQKLGEVRRELGERLEKVLAARPTAR